MVLFELPVKTTAGQHSPHKSAQYITMISQ